MTGNSKCRAYGVLFLGLVGVSLGCLPHHLEKYQTKQVSKGNPLTDKNLTGPMEGPEFALTPGIPPAITPKNPKERELREPVAPPASLLGIYQVDRNTFHFRVAEAEVWESVLDVLMRNYSLAIVDRNSGVLATDWDSFYLGKSVFRNKLSFRVKKTGLARQEAGSGVDLTVHNSVEKLSESGQGVIGLGAVWLPAKDPIEEVHRVIQNMAMILRQPPPVKMVEPEAAKTEP